MESIGVLMACPMSRYLEEELDKRFKLYRFWEVPKKKDFLKDNSNSIRAIVGNATAGADAETIDLLPKLEIVSSFSVGLDKIDLAKCKERGIRVTNTPDVLTEDVADLAIGLMLATLRRLCECDRYVRSGMWKKGDFKLTTKGYEARTGNFLDKVSISLSVTTYKSGSDAVQPKYIKTATCMPERQQLSQENGAEQKVAEAERIFVVFFIEKQRDMDHQDCRFCAANCVYSMLKDFSGKSIGIIGLGRIGLAVAKRAEAFGCPISYYSRSKKSDTNYKYYSNIMDLAANCQILVVACPLTEETHHIVNRQVMDALGPKGVVINIGRGPHVDEPELVSALVEGRLGGAGLDVFEHEPQVPEQLFQLDNVVLLPHVGSGTVETRTAMADLVIGNLEAYFQNKPLLTPVV